MCSDGHKLIQTGADRFELYDLDNDPAEQHELSQARPERVATMRDQIAAFARHAGEVGQTARQSIDEPDPAVAQRLRSLGYLD